MIKSSQDRHRPKARDAIVSHCRVSAIPHMQRTTLKCFTGIQEEAEAVTQRVFTQICGAVSSNTSGGVAFKAKHKVLLLAT